MLPPPVFYPEAPKPKKVAKFPLHLRQPFYKGAFYMFHVAVGKMIGRAEGHSDESELFAGAKLRADRLMEYVDKDYHSSKRSRLEHQEMLAMKDEGENIAKNVHDLDKAGTDAVVEMDRQLDTFIGGGDWPWL